MAQKTGQEIFRDKTRHIDLSLWDTVRASEKAKQNEGFFGYGVTADCVIVSLILVGIGVLYFFMPVLGSFCKSTDLARMIQRYKGDYLNPQIVPELYLYCCKHKLLSPIVHRYKANVGDFALIYLYLLAKCRVSNKGHFIPISTFFFAASLDYVLAKKDCLGCDDIFWLKRYFGLPA